LAAPSKNFDFAIITALSEEFSAACGMLHRSAEVYNPTIERPFHFRRCYIRNKLTSYSGIVFQSQDKGRIDAAILLACILREWRFRLIGVIGIAGGIPRGEGKERIPELADVVFAETIVDVENRKIIPEGEIDRFHSYFISREIRELFLQFNSSYSYRRPYVEAMRRIGYRPQTLPKLHSGAVISGNEVLAHHQERTAVAQRVARSDRLGFPLCAEMEGAGIAVCANRLGISNRIFMMRGISDFADANKSVDEKIWRTSACDNAAFFGAEFIKYVALREGWSGTASVSTAPSLGAGRKAP
jgi:nucleoside phosphorylase